MVSVEDINDFTSSAGNVEEKCEKSHKKYIFLHKNDENVTQM